MSKALGGIDETEVTVKPGVTVLAGRNATNRTSLLQAIMAAMGSDEISLKADADGGSVELDLSGDTYTRRLRRQNGTVRLTGDPYLDDSTLADLFAFQLESNEVRRAIAEGANPRDLLMRPIDTAKNQAQYLTKFGTDNRTADERLSKRSS